MCACLLDEFINSGVCVCVCVYVCVYVCVCVDVLLFAVTYLSLYVSLYVPLYVSLYVSLYVFRRVCRYKIAPLAKEEHLICVLICAHIYVRLSIIHMYTYMYIFIIVSQAKEDRLICVLICAHMYVCLSIIHMCIYNSVTGKGRARAAGGDRAREEADQRRPGPSHLRYHIFNLVNNFVLKGSGITFFIL